MERKIVVFDGYTLNPGDLSWDELYSIGECEIYDRTRPADVVERAKGADILLTNKTPINAGALENLPGLEYIGVMATGYNIVDVEAAAAHNIIVTNVPEYGTRSVAQAVFSILLELTNHTGHHSQAVKEGRWVSSEDFCYWDYSITELDGLVMGIIGYGRIGKTVGEIAKSFGMDVIVYDVNRTGVENSGVRFVELEDIFIQSDVVSLHCPLTRETEKMVNKNRLGLMKKSAFFLNASRGPLVEETDLADALNSGVIAGAGLDVLSVEPPKKDNPLLSAKNTIITPHIAWAAFSARKRLMGTVIFNIKEFLKGNPANIVKSIKS